MNKKETLLTEEENSDIYVLSSSKDFLIQPKTVGLHVSITLALRSMQESGIKLSAVHKYMLEEGHHALLSENKIWNPENLVKKKKSNLNTRH